MGKKHNPPAADGAAGAVDRKRRRPLPGGSTAPLAAFIPQPPGVTRRWDCLVPPVFTSRGMEKGLAIAIFGMLRILKGCPTGYAMRANRAAEGGYLRGTRGTPNHRFGTRIVYYAWSRTSPNATEEQREDARTLILDFLDLQVREGHMFGELMTTSHCEIWYADILALRAFAIHFNDTAVIEATGRWLRHDAYLLDLVTFDNDGVPRSGGARPAEADNVPVRTVMAALYNKRSCPPLLVGFGKPNIPTNPFWSNSYNIGPQTARELIRDGDDLGGVLNGERECPVLRDPMYVWRGENGDWYVHFPRFTKSGPAVMPWVGRFGGVYQNSGIFRKGEARDWESPTAPTGFDPGKVAAVPGSGVRPYDFDTEEEET